MATRQKRAGWETLDDMMTGERESQLIEAADLLLDARRTGVPIEDLPEALQPKDMTEAYALQDHIAEAYGAIGGWKIGAPSAEAEPLFAPMPRAWMAGDGAVVGEVRRYRGLESEIAFLMGEDLPGRATPYSREEVVAAIASCHPAIEVIESGLLDPLKAARMSMLGDLQMHGGFVYGPAVAEWKKIDFKTEHVVIAVDGAVRVERTGSNTSGDLMRLLPWLANEGAARTGGLKAGQWVTTGSWTGVTAANSGSVADVKFSSAGEVHLRFE
ncbi:2-keto-4-pentenoate hydratase [Tunturibacter empetritectus]|uniref:2-keto-4-pentenoate hydratase n=2 Tax=Tunturiibacter empetritectus TaxID=3069691 RepID=A0A7W8IFJ3_9BACT|nr:fumarylacetoacetate hydrolase family protein [Edaphobacter lichenicola]MBB5316205.1 2-keto-4-pentenoate hydratase [Edaphobacter lichenicola]